MSKGMCVLWAAVVALCLPHVAAATTVVVDNSDPEVTYTGTWPTSTYFPGHVGLNYQHSNKTPDITATYTPDLPEAGFYQVEAHWVLNMDRGLDVPYTIAHADGSTTVYRDQRGSGNSWAWNDLGTYRFTAGTGGSVEVSSNVSNNTFVVVDGMRFTTAPDPGLVTTVGPAADAFIQGNNSQHGSDPIVQVKSEGVNLDWSRKGYVRFDLAGVPFDTAGELADAALTLNFVASGVGSTAADETYQFSVFGLNDDAAGQGWAESGIVWDNAPGNDPTSHDGVNADATLLGTFMLTGQGLGPLEFSSDEMLDFLRDDSDGLVTFIVTRNTPQNGPGGVGDSYSHAFASKENPDVSAAELSLVRQEIPEPLSLLSVLLGAGAAAGYRRRRRA